MARMAVKKRSKKKPVKQKHPQRSRVNRLVRLLFGGLILAVLAVGGIYYFGSFETRNALVDAAQRTLNQARSAQWMPRIVSGSLDRLYDSVPLSEGLTVDGGELGRTLSPILAGIPQSRKPIRVLQNMTYINLYDERAKQPLCIAYRLSNAESEAATVSPQILNDPRVASPRMQDLESNNWQATGLAPAAALAREFGTTGASETHLSSNFVPMPQSFVDGIWQQAILTITEEYPRRFDEVWIYTGPIYKADSAQLANGILAPEAIYCIVFDLTDSGGLRAIAFTLPTTAGAATSLQDCRSSIASIERATGLSFLPEIGFDARDLLLNWVSPQLW
ncbi:MAG: endonuclease G [Lentimonas sp.]|jgi:endonuclease G